MTYFLTIYASLGQHFLFLADENILLEHHLQAVLVNMNSLIYPSMTFFFFIHDIRKEFSKDLKFNV